MEPLRGRDISSGSVVVEAAVGEAWKEGATERGELVDTSPWVLSCVFSLLLLSCVFSLFPSDASLPLLSDVMVSLPSDTSSSGVSAIMGDVLEGVGRDRDGCDSEERCDNDD